MWSVFFILFSFLAAFLFLPYAVEGLSFIPFSSLSGLAAFKHQIAHVFSSGEYPLWNPYIMCGAPFHSGIGVLDPFLIPQFFLKGSPGLIGSSYLALVFAGFFMFVYLRRSLGLPKAASFLGGALYLANPFFAASSPEAPFMTAPVYLPLIMLLSDLSISRKSYFYAFLTGLALAMTFLSGNIESWYYAALVLFVMQFGRMILSGSRAPEKNNMASARFLLTTFIASLSFMAIDLLPTLEAALSSGRNESGKLFQTAVYVMTSGILALLAAVFFGRIDKRKSALSMPIKVLLAALFIALFSIRFQKEPFYFGFKGSIFYPDPSLIMTHGSSALSCLKGAIDLPVSMLKKVIGERNIFFFQDPSYLFTFPTLLIFLSVLGMKRSRSVQFYFFLALFLALPAYTAFPDPFKHIFHMESIQFPRIMFAFFFLTSMLIAIAAAQMPKRAVKQRVKTPLFAAVFLFSSALIVWVVFLYVGPFQPGQFKGLIQKYISGFGKLNPAQSFILNVRIDQALLRLLCKDNMYTVALLFIKPLTFISLLLFFFFRSSRLLKALLIGLVAIESLLSWNTYTFQKKDIKMIDGEWPETVFLRKMGIDYRMGLLYDDTRDIYSYYDYSRRLDLGGNMPLYWGLKTIEKSAMNFTRPRFDELWRVEDANISANPSLLIGMKSRVYDIMGMKYLLARKEIVNNSYLPSASYDNYNIYENTKALPRFYVPQLVEQKSGPDIKDKIKDKGFNPLNTSYIEFPEVTGEAVSSSGKNVRWEIIKEGFNYISMKVMSSAPVFLLTTDSFDRNWKVYIDGVKSKVYLCNYYFRGIYLGEGGHKVKFRYEPFSFLIGAVISSASLCFMLFLFLRSRRQVEKRVKDGKIAV